MQHNTQLGPHRNQFRAVALIQWLWTTIIVQWIGIAILQVGQFTTDVLNCCRYILAKHVSEGRRAGTSIRIALKVLLHAQSS